MPVKPSGRTRSRLVSILRRPRAEACMSAESRFAFSRMGRRFQISVILLAWLMASGVQWDLVQTFAWGRMFASYSRAMPVAQAVRMTFMPANMCASCRAVEKAKQQESAPAVPNGKADGKLILVFEPVPDVPLQIPDKACWLSSEGDAVSALRSGPPTPPPRAA